MGQIWRGLDQQLLRRVAAKTFASKAAAALDHVNVATVYDTDIASEPR